MDLDSLLSALQTTQQKKSSVRLSERNVVELVMKLKQLGLFGEELLHTINGKEYITTDRLKTDIQDALRKAGGRLELTELPALVGVDLVHCEKQAALIVSESGGSVLEAQGELITTQYFDSLAAEINELLQEAGVLSMADLAVSYALNTELLRGIVAARVGSTIAGRLEAGLLHTPAYVRNIKAQLRGALRGTAAPVALQALARDLGLDAFGGSNSMLSGLVDELLAEGAVCGSTKGGGGGWVPSIHTAVQQRAVAGFWAQNGWLSYEFVRKAGISSEKSYVRTTFPGGEALESVYVSSSLVGVAEAAVDEALRNGGWLDVATVLPPALSVADVAQLLERCRELLKDPEHKRGQVLASTCVVSAPLIAAARARLEGFAKQEAERAIQERRRSTATAVSSNGAGAAGDAGKAAGGGKKGGASAAKDDDSDDDWSMGGGGKKGKKGKAAPAPKGKGGKAGGGATPGKPGKGGNSGGGGADGGSALSVSVLVAQLLELFPDMEDAGPNGGLPKALAELLRPAALAAHAAALAAVFTSTAEARRAVKEAASRALADGFALLQLYGHGCELCESDEATLQLLQRHLLRSTGTDALDQLLCWCRWEFDEEAAAAAAEQQQPGGAAAAAAAAAAASFTPAERSKLAKAVPAEVGQALTRAVEAANGGDVQELVTQLEAAAAECGIRLRRLDKKSEKALLAAQRARLAALLEPEQAPAAALALAVPLLAARVAGRLVNVPGRAISGLLAALQPSMAEEEFSLVQQFHQQVVDSLKLQSRQQQQQEEEQGGGQQLEGQQLAEQLAALLPRVKAVVGGSGGSSVAAASS